MSEAQSDHLLCLKDCPLENAAAIFLEESSFFFQLLFLAVLLPVPLELRWIFYPTSSCPLHGHMGKSTG